MKPLKSRLAVPAAFLLAALLCLVIVVNNVNNQGADAPDADWQTPTPDTAAPGDVLPQAPPVLTIGGQENPDVYLQSLDIRVEVTGNIASTRYTMVFKNRANRILEGELTFPLPDGRSVTYYALDINGKMREAVPVEKAKGTQVFEEIEQRRVDPGLLERVEGNNFRTRIYPIPANGIRTISIGYEEELTLEGESLYYRLPMAYPDSLEMFTMKATVWNGGKKPLVPQEGDEIVFEKMGENYVAWLTRQNYRPARALIFALPAPADIPQVMMQSAQGSYYFLASVAPKTETRKKQWADDLAIIWDVSLSGSQRNLRREMEMLEIIFAEKKNANAHLYLLNNKITKNGEYKVVNGRWNGLKNALNKAVFDGGTDFSQINLNNIAGNEILFFSDGISTLSDADFIRGAKVNRPVHCVVSSAKADYSAMKLIASKTKGKFVNVNALSSRKLKDGLLNETLMFLGVEHGNAVREVYPGIAAPVHGNFSVAGISDVNNAELTLLFGFGNKVEKRIKVRLDAKMAAGQGNTYKIWAQKKIAELDLDYGKNRGELMELGRQFGIVTRNTSLIVLETIGDYVRYGIEPPASEPALLAEYQRGLKGRDERRRNTERGLIEKAVVAAEKAKIWWDTDFPLKKTGGDSGQKSSGSKGVAGIGYGSGYGSGFGGSGGGIDDLLGGLMGGLKSGGGLDLKKPDGGISQPAITVKPVKTDNNYLNGLTGKTANDYKSYLKLRDDYAGTPAFYFDMADWFYTHGDRETALRVLTSIADLEFENASLYKLLGYRFKEYGEYALEKFVFSKVIDWRPMEPQSYRDYALALADNGEEQAALDSLYSMLVRPYSENIIWRSRGIEGVAVTEINRLIAKNQHLNTSKIDKRLLMDAAVDIRVVINWNVDNTIIDLHVVDPNDEECSWSHLQTYIGGLLSDSEMSGYGPEQFLLKKAVKGKYRIYVNYYGEWKFTSAVGPAIVMAEIYTKYAGKTEQRKIVTLQRSSETISKSADKKVELAEFEF